MKSRGMILLITLMNLLAFGRGDGDRLATGRGDWNLCSGNGNYTSNSTYRANLISLLSSLSSNMMEFGFYTSSIDQNPDRVNVFAICITGQTLDECRDCVESASHEILQQCPNQKEAISWRVTCVLRYSNNSMLKNPTTRPRMLLYNSRNASNEEGHFTENLEILLSELRDKAAGGSLFKFGAGSRNIPGLYLTIFGLVWCTPDLSSEDCSSCLNIIYPMIHEPGGLQTGCRVLVPSCYLNYELYPFYNATKLRQLQLVTLSPPPPPPPLSPLPSPPGKNDDDNTKLVILVIVPTGICLMLIASAVIILRKRKKRRKQGIIKNEISIVESLQYDFGTIRAATSDFGDANKLGQGGFGVVYRGKFEDGQEIAAKRLSNDSGQGDIEFKNEVVLVARLQHRNLVKLLGFSIEGRERILVYEFVQNASLDKFIFDPVKRSELGWDARNKIIGGVARGLLYLHEDSRLRIIHRDLKASNVLLDGNLNPKIADFGMARLFKQDETHGDTNKIVGTFGYMSPEYAMYGQFSIKSDVFSFGVLILEIISGRRNKIVRGGENVEDLLTLTWENWRGGTTTDMIDPILRTVWVQQMRC